MGTEIYRRIIIAAIRGCIDSVCLIQCAAILFQTKCTIRSEAYLRTWVCVDSVCILTHLTLVNIHMNLTFLSYIDV